MRQAQVEKRQRKLVGMAGEMSGPRQYGPPEADLTFLCWGSTYGPLREAVDRLNAKRKGPSTQLRTGPSTQLRTGPSTRLRTGPSTRLRTGRANLLHFVDLWPFPTEAVTAALELTQKVVAVENNATAQLATLIRANTGRSVDGKILRYDGRPFTPEYILARVAEL